MDSTTPDRPHDADLIDRVVAWHNRSALTSRITPAQVGGIGIVALPFAALPLAAGDEPPLADADPHSGGRIGTALVAFKYRLRVLGGRLRIGRKTAARALFDEDFIAPLKPRLVARFANRHADLQRPGDADWQQRVIAPTVADLSTARSTRYLRTATIESGSTRLRILIGRGSNPTIIGPRLWSRRRLSGLLAGLCTTVIASTLAMAWPAFSPFASGEHLALADSAVAAPAVAPTAVPPTQPSSSPIDAPVAVAVPVAVASTASAPESTALAAPAIIESTPELPDTRPPVAIDRAATPPLTAPSVEPEVPSRPKYAKMAKTRISAPAAAAPAPAATPNGAPGRVFALAAEPTRSRVGSMLRLTLLDLPTEPQQEGAHAELMRTGAQWRVVIWPFADRQAAQQAQGLLASRGLKVELIAF